MIILFIACAIIITICISIGAYYSYKEYVEEEREWEKYEKYRKNLSFEEYLKKYRLTDKDIDEVYSSTCENHELWWLDN